MRYSQKVALSFYAAAALTCSWAARADVLAFNPSGGDVSGNSMTSFLGYQFTVSTPITLTGLGIVLPNGGVVSDENHAVSLYKDNNGTAALASTTVITGESANNGNAAVNALATPLSLAAGDYWIGASYSGGDYTDQMYDSGVSFGAASGITWDKALDNLDGHQNYDQVAFSSSSQQGFFGPDFSFVSAVPEPSSISLLALGAGALALIFRRRPA